MSTSLSPDTKCPACSHDWTLHQVVYSTYGPGEANGEFLVGCKLCIVSGNRYGCRTGQG